MRLKPKAIFKYNSGMNPLLLTPLLLLSLLLATPVHAAPKPSQENCSDEICDGLDNDCDGSIDDNADCGLHAQCGCGVCAKEMVGGKCESGISWQGFCLEDHCPSGTACNVKTGK